MHRTDHRILPAAHRCFPDGQRPRAGPLNPRCGGKRQHINCSPRWNRCLFVTARRRALGSGGPNSPQVCLVFPQPHRPVRAAGAGRTDLRPMFAGASPLANRTLVGAARHLHGGPRRRSQETRCNLADIRRQPRTVNCHLEGAPDRFIRASTTRRTRRCGATDFPDYWAASAATGLITETASSVSFRSVSVSSSSVVCSNRAPSVSPSSSAYVRAQP